MQKNFVETAKYSHSDVLPGEVHACGAQAADDQNTFASAIVQTPPVPKMRLLKLRALKCCGNGEE
jgi:hypothetical protein